MRKLKLAFVFGGLNAGILLGAQINDWVMERDEKKMEALEGCFGIDAPIEVNEYGGMYCNGVRIEQKGADIDGDGRKEVVPDVQGTYDTYREGYSYSPYVIIGAASIAGFIAGAVVGGLVEDVIEKKKRSKDSVGSLETSITT